MSEGQPADSEQGRRVLKDIDNLMGVIEFLD